MVAYEMNNSTFASKLDIKQEINTFGQYSIRPGDSLTIVFASLDSVNPQSISIFYLHALKIGFSLALSLALVSLVIVWLLINTF